MRGSDFAAALDRRWLLGLAVVAVVLTAGCAAAPGEQGEVNGYRADADIAVTFEDGLNDSEQEAVVSRAMARIEVLRDQDFDRVAPVEVITRAEFRNRTGGDTPDPSELSDRQLWNEQVWEALHIVGEDETFPESRGTNRGSSVVGYYSSDNIVIVSDAETPQISRGTLVHELVHALQDQRLGFGPNREFQDGQLARRGVIEGEANYLEALYRQRCDEGRWECIPQVQRSGSRSRPDSFNQALFLVSFAPYAEGPNFIQAVESRGGWDAVNDLYDDFPETTEQIIHPRKYPRESARDVSVPDRSTEAWSRFTDLDRPAADTVGEASIYAMFRGNGVITGGQQYDYDHPLSAGWAGDSLVPYRNDDAYGYVWRTAWDSRAQAREFAEGYRELLDDQGARSLDEGRYRIDDGAFADAFRVTRDRDTVTVVNAPTPQGLDAVHEPAE
jgi:hypothetical protein